MSALFPSFLFPLFTQAGDEKEGAKLAPISPGKYILFADPAAVDFESIQEMVPLDGVEIEIIAVQPRGDQSISDCVLLYRLGQDES